MSNEDPKLLGVTDTRVMTISDFFKCIEEKAEDTIKAIEAMQRFYPGAAPVESIGKLRWIASHCERKALEFKGDMRTPERFQDDRFRSSPRSIMYE